jgi:TP901 family phage tail tape measure protein
MARGARKAEFEVGARSRKLDRGLREANRKLKRFGTKAAKDVNRGFAGVKRTLGTLAGFAGIGLFGAMAKSAFNFEKRLTRLGIQGGRTSAEMSLMSGRMRQISDEMGVSKDEVLDGAEAYVTLTGDMDGAASAMETFAKVASGTGAAMSDIAGTAAALKQNLKIDPKDFEKAFSVLTFQGNAGAIELKELSTLMASVTAQFPNFGNAGVEGLSELGASLQVVRRGFGSGAEAATGYMALMTSITRSAGKLKRAGVKVYDTGPGGVKRLRNMSTIVRDISRSKLMKDPTKLQKALGGRGEAVRALDTMIKDLADIEDLKNEGLKSDAVQAQYLKYQASSAARMERAWTRLKNKIYEAITPARIEKFAAAMEMVSDLVGFLADHLYVVGGALLAMKIGPGLLSLIRFVRELRAAGGLKALLGNAGGMAGKLGTGFGIAAAAALGIAIGRYIDNELGISKSLDTDAGEIDTSTAAGKRQQAALNAAGKVRRRKQQSSGDRFWGFAKGVGVGGVAGALQPEHQRFEDVEVADGYREALKLRSQQLYKEAAEQERVERLAKRGAAIEAAQNAGSETERLVQVAITVDQQGLLKAEERKERKGRTRR